MGNREIKKNQKVIFNNNNNNICVKFGIYSVVLCCFVMTFDFCCFVMILCFSSSYCDVYLCVSDSNNQNIFKVVNIL